MTSNNTGTTDSPGRTYGGRSLDVRKQQRSAQFLAAGLNVFGTTGFRNATVRSLCDEAKLTSRYFYESFDNLEALIAAVYEECMFKLGKQVVDVIKQTYKHSGEEQAIIAGLDAYFLALEDSRVARICMLELEAISPETTQLCYRYMGVFAQILIMFANHAHPNWSLDDEEKDVIGMSFVGALRQTATVWLLADYKAPRSTLVGASSQLFLGMIALNHSLT